MKALQEFLQYWKQNPWFTTIGIIFGIFLIVGNSFFSEAGKALYTYCCEKQIPLSIAVPPSADYLSPSIARIEGPGTRIKTTVDRVIDGDTIKVFLSPENTKSKSLRMLAIDTEEVHAGSSKPVTQLGHDAKEFAEKFFEKGDEVEIEFPGHEPTKEALRRYRGGYGRLTVYIYKDGVDYQEAVIERGLSPYFVKYGYSNIVENHIRYQAAERRAQAMDAGIWNQVERNGSQLRNYKSLRTWWILRAEKIRSFKIFRNQMQEKGRFLASLEGDYETILEAAAKSETMTIFAEVRQLVLVGGDAIMNLGGREQPFSLFIPNVDRDQSKKILNLLRTRYLSDGESKTNVSYAYFKGPLRLENGKPVMELRSISQISDEP
jgi:micrococcal nuclease